MNTRSLPQSSLSTRRIWLQLSDIGSIPLPLATLTAYSPPWASSVSRPKNTEGMSARDVSHPVGIHSWPLTTSSKPGFLSRFRGAALADAAAAAHGAADSAPEEKAEERETRDDHEKSPEIRSRGCTRVEEPLSIRSTSAGGQALSRWGAPARRVFAPSGPRCVNR